MFYDQFAKLCSIRGVSRTKACIDCGVSRTAWHKWESGATPNGATINKFSAYFGVPVGQLLGENEKTPTLTTKDERDVARDVERIMNNLEDSGELMFDGVPMSEEAKAAMAAAMRIGLEEAKRRNKETYTPKKYKGE